MKYSVFIIALLFISSTAQSQINKGKKLVGKGHFEEAIEAFEKDLKKPTNKPVSLYELAKIYFNEKFKDYNLEKAYEYVSQALKEYDALNAANRKKLQKKGLSKMGMHKYQTNVVIAAEKVVEQANTLDKAEHFLNFYKTASKHQVERMVIRRDILAFEAAEKQDKFAAYESFYKEHELTCQQHNEKLLIKAQKKLLESYIAEKGWAVYPAFEEKYTTNIYVQDQKAAYALIKIARKKDLKEYKHFVEAYPNSLFNKFVQDYMFDVIMLTNSLPDYDYFVRAYPDYEKGEKIWQRFYKLYLQEHGKEATAEFYKSYPKYPFRDSIKSDGQEREKE